jgi:hypothetical protein
LERYGRNQPWFNARYYPRIYLEGPSKTMKSRSQNIRSPCRNSNRQNNEYPSLDSDIRCARTGNTEFLEETCFILPEGTVSCPATRHGGVWGGGGGTAPTHSWPRH